VAGPRGSGMLTRSGGRGPRGGTGHTSALRPKESLIDAMLITQSCFLDFCVDTFSAIWGYCSLLLSRLPGTKLSGGYERHRRCNHDDIVMHCMFGYNPRIDKERQYSCSCHSSMEIAMIDILRYGSQRRVGFI